jgi:hypothetical protein
MKKKLEADLISIAHRILKLKNKENLAQLHLETQKLYEKLSVLKFVEDNFSDVKPTIGNSNIQELVNAALENELEAAEVAPEETEIQPDLVEEEIEEEVEEEEEDDSDEEEEFEEEIEADEEEDEEETFENIEESEEEEEESEEEKEFEPHFELFNVEEVEDKKSKKEAKQISFEDLLGSNSEPIFERVFDPIQEETEEESDDEEETEDEEAIFNPGFEMEASEEMEEEEKAIPNFEFDNEISINEAFAKTITFGLNDRIAFEKQLFAGSSEDLNRVVSQLSTFDTFEEAQNFIEDMVPLDPLYLVDHHEELFEPSVANFTPEYQRRLRQYVVSDRTHEAYFTKLPQGQFGLIFAYNFFNFKPIEIIRQYITELFGLMRPGGTLIMTYNNCDRAQGVGLVERGFMCYTPKKLIVAHAESVGFECDFEHDGAGDVSWLEFRKPGEITSLRGGQTLAKIVANSQ